MTMILTSSILWYINFSNAFLRYNNARIAIFRLNTCEHVAKLHQRGKKIGNCFVNATRVSHTHNTVALAKVLCCQFVQV
jgi:hypothetical protein